MTAAAALPIPGLGHYTSAFDSDSTDVHLIWDSGRSRDLRDIWSALSQWGIPVLNFEAKSFLKKFEKGNDLCPVFGKGGKSCGDSGTFRIPENTLFSRFDSHRSFLTYARVNVVHSRHGPFRHDHKYPLFLVLVSSARSLRSILEAFNRTALQCPQFIDAGVFHPDSQFLFDAVDAPNAAEEVFDYEYFRAISKVAVTESSTGGAATSVRAFDILRNDIALRCVGSKCSDGDVFTTFEDFAGYRMRVSTMPYSPNVLDGDGHLSDASSEYWGYEIDMLQEMR